MVGTYYLYDHMLFKNGPVEYIFTPILKNEETKTQRKLLTNTTIFTDVDNKQERSNLKSGLWLMHIALIPSSLFHFESREIKVNHKSALHSSIKIFNGSLCLSTGLKSKFLCKAFNALIHLPLRHPHLPLHLISLPWPLLTSNTV